MSQISESRTKLVWILPSVRDFARRAMFQISDSRSFRGSGLVKQSEILHLYKEVLIYLQGKFAMVKSQ